MPHMSNMPWILIYMLANVLMLLIMMTNSNYSNINPSNKTKNQKKLKKWMW